MLWVWEESGVGYELIQKGGNLGETGAELNSDDNSVNALQTDSLSDMIKMERMIRIVVSKAVWCGVAVEAWDLYKNLLAQLSA